MARRGESVKAVEWRERLNRFVAAGISVTRFCREEGVSQPSFFAWRKKLRGAGGGEPEFAAVRVLGGECVSAWLPGGTRIEVPSGDERVIAAVVEALVRADATSARGAAC